MKLHRLAFILALSAMSGHSPAIDLEDAAKQKKAEQNIQSNFSSQVKKMMSEIGEIEALKMIPVKGIMLVQLKGKPPIFLSSNGRFLIEGSIKDLWNMKPVETAEQAQETWLLNLDKFGDGQLLNKLAIIDFGNPQLPVQARVFVSPTVKASQDFLSSINPNEIHLELVIFPHEKETITPSLKAYCASSITDTLQSLMTGVTDKLSQRKCDESDLQKVMMPMMMATYLDINMVPYFVRVDGKRHAGVPEMPLKWLNHNKQPTKLNQKGSDNVKQ